MRPIAHAAIVVDRAGFEPATFRFPGLLALQTGRSLAHFAMAYQAELPARSTSTVVGWEITIAGVFFDALAHGNYSKLVSVFSIRRVHRTIADRILVR